MMTDGDALSARGGGILSRAQYIEEIDLGEPEGPRTILSGLVPYMSAEEIAGKKVIVFANLKVRAELRRRDRRGKPRAREREREREKMNGPIDDARRFTLRSGA